MQTIGLTILKFSFIIILFIIFINCFGIPAFRKFAKNESVVVVTTESEPDGHVLAPAITVCRRNSITEAGWKNEIDLENTESMFEAVCNNRSGNKNIFESILNSTFSENETANVMYNDNIQMQASR